jgi:hypothetical protein
MIEAYAFLAVFAVQILAMSVLLPAWIIRYVRAQAMSFPAERFAQLYPGVDHSLTLERYLTRYRVLNTAIAVIGLLLLGWLFSQVRRPTWDEDDAKTLACLCFLLQALPHCLYAWLAVRFKNNALKRSLPEGKRKANLQRRGLFDFVSPLTVFLAVLSFLLFAAFVIYIEQDPFRGFAGYINIGALMLVYAVNAFCVYTTLYGKKINPLETHADSEHTIGLAVKAYIFSCIVCVVFLSLDFTLTLLNLERWEPFATSVFFVTCALLSFMGLTAPPRQPEGDGLGSSSVP